MKRVDVLSRENLASLSSRKPMLPEIELSTKEHRLEVWDMPLYHMPIRLQRFISRLFPRNESVRRVLDATDYRAQHNLRMGHISPKLQSS